MNPRWDAQAADAPIAGETATLVALMAAVGLALPISCVNDNSRRALLYSRPMRCRVLRTGQEAAVH